MQFCSIKKSLFLQHLAQTSPTPPMYEFTKGRGIYLYDALGNKFIDLISGISVNNIGHSNKAVRKAVTKQMKKYMHQMVYGEYIVGPQVELAQKLSAVLPKNLQSFYFLNSGSEAIEGAIKLCRKYTGRTKLVAMRNAYHGSTTGALSLMSDSYYSGSFRPTLPEVYFADYNDTNSLDIIDQHTAAVFVELVQAESGYIPINLDFLLAISQKCKETGALLIADEIQTGMGRTGKLFAFEQTPIVPDILVLAKGLGGGMPISAFISSPEIMECLKDKPILGHITTFGGHPVSCTAASATLDFIIKENLLAGISEKERLFRELLVHPKISGISGKGLMLAVQLPSFDEVERTMKRCIERGLIIDWFLYNTTALRISPPLIITEKQIRKVCSILLEALD
jgi:acetylornithine/succinyldiaminopimelate/putrescine aminotransferase